MTVAKLIKMLGNMPQDAIVYAEDGTSEDDIDRYTCFSKVSTNMTLKRHKGVPCLLIRNEEYSSVLDYEFEEYKQ